MRPKWPGEDTGGSSAENSEPYSSADEASQAGWHGMQLCLAPCMLTLLCLESS